MARSSARLAVDVSGQKTCPDEADRAKAWGNLAARVPSARRCRPRYHGTDTARYPLNMPIHRALGSIEVVRLDGCDDGKMFERITVPQIGIEHFCPRDRPSGLLLDPEDLVDDANHEAISAGLRYAAMKKFVPPIPGRPILGRRGAGFVPLHQRKVGWFRPQGRQACGLRFDQRARFEKLAQCRVSPQRLSAGLDGLGTPPHERALADMAPNSTLSLQFLQTVPQRGPTDL